jgi:predicted metal-binding protein
MSDILCSKCNKGNLRKLETTIKADVFICDKCGSIQIWGPCCDQGWIRYMRIKGKESTIFICEECDTVWESICNIGTESRKAYSKYAEENGIVDTWDILEELPITKSLLDRTKI